jgi:hypothetical protein
MPWTPSDEPWADYYRQIFPGHSNPRTAYDSWKYASTAVNITRQLWETRERGRNLFIEHHGPNADHWPVPHPPVVLWIPVVLHPACLRCTWITSVGSAEEAGQVARAHAFEHVPRSSRVAQYRVPVLPRNGAVDDPPPAQWL